MTKEDFLKTHKFVTTIEDEKGNAISIYQMHDDYLKECLKDHHDFNKDGKEIEYAEGICNILLNKKNDIVNSSYIILSKKFMELALKEDKNPEPFQRHKKIIIDTIILSLSTFPGRNIFVTDDEH